MTEVKEKKYAPSAEQKELIKGYYEAKKNGFITSSKPSAAQEEAVKEYQAQTGKGTKATQADIATW